MQNIQKLDSLTSLRFFAAAMIVIGHAHGLFGSAGIATTFSLAQGVSFFFVLSGFILAYNYQKLTSFSEVKQFYVARFARIFPSHIVAILFLVFLTGGINQGGLQGASIFFTGILQVLLLQSIVPLKDVFLTFNGVSWSISTEMFFYLLFPLLITSIIPGRWSKLFIIIGVVTLYLCFGVLWNVSYDEGGSQFSLMGLLYVNPWVRIFEFYIGILTCQLYLKSRSHINDNAQTSSKFSVLEFGAILLALATLWLSPRITAYMNIPGQLGIVISYYLTKSGSVFSFAFLIFIFAFGKGLVNKVLSHKLFVLLGEISFALYLVHTTVLFWFQQHIAFFSGHSKIVQACIFWLLSLAVAWFLHRLVELPCRKLILTGYKKHTFATTVIDKSLIVNACFAAALFVGLKIFVQ